MLKICALLFCAVVVVSSNRHSHQQRSQYDDYEYEEYRGETKSNSKHDREHDYFISDYYKPEHKIGDIAPVPVSKLPELEEKHGKQAEKKDVKLPKIDDKKIEPVLDKDDKKFKEEFIPKPLELKNIDAVKKNFEEKFEPLPNPLNGLKGLKDKVDPDGLVLLPIILRSQKLAPTGIDLKRIVSYTKEPRKVEN